jgi:hypothetical protein
MTYTGFCRSWKGMKQQRHNCIRGALARPIESQSFILPHLPSNSICCRFCFLPITTGLNIKLTVQSTIGCHSRRTTIRSESASSRRYCKRIVFSMLPLTPAQEFWISLECKVGCAWHDISHREKTHDGSQHLLRYGVDSATSAFISKAGRTAQTWYTPARNSCQHPCDTCHSNKHACCGSWACYHP